MNIKILVASHKPGYVYCDDIYTPIQVGKELSPYNIENMIGDNTGDNISTKNPMYCELTALYWAWKNLKGIDYIGLCHYRRYFDFHKQIPSYSPHTYLKTKDIESINYSIPLKVTKELKDGKIIISKHQTGRESLYTQYCLKHISDDLRTLQETVKSETDPRYIQAFKKVMRNNKFSPYNMFIMPWPEFEKYCTWLFSILKNVEAKIDTSHYNNIQKRIYGYMAERLINIYIEANNLKTKEYPIISFIDDDSYKNVSRFEYYTKTFIKNIAFHFTLPPFEVE